MSELADLIAQRDNVLKRLRKLELQINIPNEESVAAVQKLTYEQSRLLQRQSEKQAQLQQITAALDEVKKEIIQQTTPAKERVLEGMAKALDGQRWFWFYNNVGTFDRFDSYTGLIWVDSMDYTYDQFNFTNDGNLSVFDDDLFKNWQIPTYDQFTAMIADKTYPRMSGGGILVKTGEDYEYYWAWRVKDSNGNKQIISIEEEKWLQKLPNNGSALVLPVNTFLVDKYADLSARLSPANRTVQERSRLLFDIFAEIGLHPHFDNKDMEKTLYPLCQMLFSDKPKLIAQLKDLQSKIENLRADGLLSSEIDHTVWLKDYDLPSIDGSVVKYYQAVQRWIGDLLAKLDYYTQEMEPVIRDFNDLCSRLAKKYEASPQLSDAENKLLSDRQLFLQEEFSLSLADARQKLLAVKAQADALEQRINEINNGNDAIRELSLLNKEERAPFELLAENTAQIVKAALQKIEYFQSHRAFAEQAVDIWEEWTEDYRRFKASCRDGLKETCEADGLEESEWEKWYDDWQGLRLAIERKIQPMLERGLHSVMQTDDGTGAEVPGKIIAALRTYKDEIDKFFMEERKGIYQKFAFNAGGDLQDKLEVESELYKRAASLQGELQGIIFSCAKAEDRIFILQWADSLLNMQIDEILQFVADNELKEISGTILTELSALRQKNYEAYLLDAAAYAAEQSRRDKAYNALVFKMRKDLQRK